MTKDGDWSHEIKTCLLIAQLVKNPPAMQENPVRFLGWDDPLEKGKATEPVFWTGEFLVHGVAKSQIRLNDFHFHFTAPWKESYDTARQCIQKQRLLFANKIRLVKAMVFRVVMYWCENAKLRQLFPTLCDPVDGSPPGSSVPGILQARTLEWVAISFSNAWKWKVKGKSLSCVQLLATPWTAAYQAPLPMGFSRQEYWSGVPLPMWELDHKKRWAHQLSAK